jgi:hypothetical protein
MDPAQLPEPTSDNKCGSHGDAARGALGRYLEDLAGQPLAVRTRQAYASHVSTYVAWLAERPEPTRRYVSLARETSRAATSSDC